MIYTVGHGFRSLESLLATLKPHGITKIVDVRSRPYSGKELAQFNKEALKEAVEKAGLAYSWLGWCLGGKPDEDWFYDAEGYVLYDRLSDSKLFKDGLVRLQQEEHGCVVVLLCSEKDPAHCHRHNLIARVLIRDRIDQVVHIQASGTTIDAQVLLREQEAAKPAAQMSLFASAKSEWRSTKPVDRKRAPNGTVKQKSGRGRR